LSVTGTVAPWDELKVCPEISGLLINSVKVEEGTSVKKGQVLATLNSTLLEDQLEEAEAKMRSGQAGFNKALQPNRPEEILMLRAALEQAKNARNQEEANVDKAHIALASAKVNVQRFKRLFEQGAISEAEKENHQLILDNAKVELLSAEHREKASQRQEEQVQQRLLEATRGGRREDVLVSQAAIEEVRAQIKHLHGQLAQTIVRAPDDGVILRRDAHIGDTSASGKPLFTMSRKGLMELRAAVNDSDLNRLKVGQTVGLTPNGEDENKISGKIKLLSPQVDAATRMGIARIDIPNNSGLKPGMFVSGEISLSRRNLLTVPVEAIVTRSGKTFVFVAEHGRAHSLPVVAGLRSNSYVEIKSGLTKGQLVITKGARFIADNDVVDITK
jgi:RND family efflux transporter MFP subunit